MKKIMLLITLFSTSLIFSAEEQAISQLYKTTVKFKALFESETGKRWTSNQARAEVEAKMDLNAINPIDGCRGIIISVVIKKLYGQAEKGSETGKYCYPEITKEVKDLIIERILWNYRTFEQGYNQDILEIGNISIGNPHEVALCEACREGKYCTAARASAVRS